MENSVPRITASISLSPTTHSFSSTEPPKISLTFTSHHSGPITIYADTASPASMLQRNSFIIHDLTSNEVVHHTKGTWCVFEPPKRITVQLNTDLLYTLHPGVPVTREARFGRPRKPVPSGSPDLFEPGVHGPPRHMLAKGIDGLKPGHSYLLTLSENSRVPWTLIRWWEYGEKEEVLKGKDGEGIDARKVRYKKGPHDPIYLDKSDFKPIEFNCVE